MSALIVIYLFPFSPDAKVRPKKSIIP